LVSKSVTLNDLERRDGRVVRVIAFAKSLAILGLLRKVVEDTPIHFASEM